MWRYYQVTDNTAETWVAVEESESDMVREKLAMHMTYMAVNTVPGSEDFTGAKYKGPLVLDIDNKGDIAKSIEDTRKV